MSSYDFVIVGGGSAGCVLANRLSEDPSTRVLVLEAGRPDYLWDVYIHMPAALSFPIGNRFYDWKYESEPEPNMHGRRIYHARGKVLGGSSSINGMIFQRGNPLDYERWGSDPGMGSWDYAHCLPYFKRMENCLAGADEWRGGDGPLKLERGPATNPLCQAFFEAVQQAGYPLTDDVNGYRQEGFAAFDRNIFRGHRLSAARAYLHPVIARKNLEVRCRAFVNRVLLGASGRAIGVEVVERGRASNVTAGEVILCGGAINSPQLLQLSGVGNPKELKRAAVAAVHELPGVGENLQDHLEVYVQYASTQPVSVAPALKWRNRPAGRPAVAAVPQRARRHQPLRVRRLHPQQRGRRLPEPDVPLPAGRDPLRRLGAPGTRLPGARRPDVLRRPRLGQDRLEGPAGASGAAFQLPLHRPGPPRVGRGGPLRAPDPHPARLRPLQRRRAVPGTHGRDRRRGPRLGRTGRGDGAAPLVHREDGDRRRRGPRPGDDARSRPRRTCASSTPRRCPTSPTATSTHR